MDSIKRVNLKVNKKALMIIGGLVWTFAGSRVLSLGYIIMTFMMTVGIGVRSLGIINHNYLGIFYIGLGFALSLGGIIFLLNGIKYKRES